MSKRTVEVDVVSEGIEDLMNKLDADGLDPKILKWSGPAGGNPLLEITGTDNQLRDALVNECGVDAGDVDELYMKD
jgi:hypothetical protein